jgi:CO/xanthine dehydrogenase FAD-binding subunit
MRTRVSSLELLEPRSLTHALRLLRDRAPAAPLAGCTDLYVSLNAGTLTQTRFVSLWGLDQLRRIGVRHGVLSIGALATYADLIASPDVGERIPILASAASLVGAVQVQNRGTIGGNIANASPAGDTLPVLAVAEAVLVLRSLDGSRRVPFNEFYTGYRRTVMRRDEILVAVEIPPVEGRQWFRKVGTRAAQAISKVVMAAVRAPRPRIALGSVAPTVVRARGAEAALAAGASIDEAKAALLADIAPIDDLRSTAAYRRQVSMNLLGRFWADTA